MSKKQHRKGDHIIQQGDAADCLFLIRRGRVDVRVPVAGRFESYRVSTFEAGRSFGELALFDGGARTADVVAASDVEVFMLDKQKFEALVVEEPEIHRSVLVSVGQSLADRLRRANQEIRILAQ